MQGYNVNHLFLTGMGRSGTTLLDRLLTSHEKIDVLSQPLPLIFVEAKQRFLKARGEDRYYVLNDDLVSRNYPQDEFNAYLDNFEIDAADIEDIFKRMESYSGQKTRRTDQSQMRPGTIHGYKELLTRCLELYNVDSDADYIGMKEPMCEEFLPYLCKNGYKTIVIIRDPRDVLASANYPRKEKYLGSKKPALFILKTWRKSAEYIYQLRKNNNFLFLRYEDLVKNPYNELNRISDFLTIDRFSATAFDEGIIDRDGNPWVPNTSFDPGGPFISNRSVGIYKNILSKEEIRYTEAITAHEMEFLGYDSDLDSNKIETIKNFRDRDVSDCEDIRSDYSSQEGNVSQELARIMNIENILYKD
jgi:hypothetical protein